MFHPVLRATAVALLTAAAGVSCQPPPPPAYAPPAPSALKVVPTATMAEDPPPPPAIAPVRVQLFVMSQCPYCSTVEASMLEALRELGPHVQFSLDFVGTVDQDGELRSMHGSPEVVGNIAQACAMHHDPQRYLAMIVCQNDDQSQVHRNWENCASQVGLALGPLRSCMQSGQGAQLLADSYQRAADKGIKASPTILLGAAPYLGRRTADSLVRAICEQFPAARPAVCLSLPQLPTVRAVILSDRRCKQCDGARLDAMVRNRVANPQVRFVDYAEPEGRQLYDALRPGPLPVLLFDASLEADAEAFKAFERSMRTEGTTRIVSSGGDWNPRCHDENGCAKAECADDLTCRRDKPKRIELYTMSLCPFAARAVVGLRELLQDLEPGITVQVQFIGTGDAATGFDSMRGADEVLEDLRQACAVQHYRAGNKFLQYMGCRAQKVRDPDWKACTGGTSGIDARVLQRCAEGAEGKRLLEASFRYARRMGVQGSPTWLLNDRVKVMGADMDVLKKQFCSLNPAVRGCQAPPP